MIIICESWVLRSKETIVINGLTKCCITNALDRNQDHMLWEESYCMNKSGEDMET